MFAHQNDGNSLSKFPKNAVAGIDMMPDACIRERSLLKYGLRAQLVYAVEREGTYVANGLRHVQSRCNVLEPGGTQAGRTPTPNPMTGSQMKLSPPASSSPS